MAKLVSPSLERVKDDLPLPGGELNHGLPRGDRRRVSVTVTAFIKGFCLVFD